MNKYFIKEKNTNGQKKLGKDCIIITSYKKNLNENFNETPRQPE